MSSNGVSQFSQYRGMDEQGEKLADKGKAMTKRAAAPRDNNIRSGEGAVGTPVSYSKTYCAAVTIIAALGAAIMGGLAIYGVQGANRAIYTQMTLLSITVISAGLFVAKWAGSKAPEQKKLINLATFLAVIGILVTPLLFGTLAAQGKRAPYGILFGSSVACTCVVGIGSLGFLTNLLIPKIEHVDKARLNNNIVHKSDFVRFTPIALGIIASIVGLVMGVLSGHSDIVSRPNAIWSLMGGFGATTLALALANMNRTTATATADVKAYNRKRNVQIFTVALAVSALPFFFLALGAWGKIPDQRMINFGTSLCAIGIAAGVLYSGYTVYKASKSRPVGGGDQKRSILQEDDASSPAIQTAQQRKYRKTG